jgi:hypothetical protein
LNVEQITPIEEAIHKEIDPEIDESEDNAAVPAPARTSAGRLSRELKGLMGSRSCTYRRSS